MGHAEEIRQWATSREERERRGSRQGQTGEKGWTQHQPGFEGMDPTGMAERACGDKVGTMSEGLQETDIRAAPIRDRGRSRLCNIGRNAAG